MAIGEPMLDLFRSEEELEGLEKLPLLATMDPEVMELLEGLEGLIYRLDKEEEELTEGLENPAIEGLEYVLDDAEDELEID